MKLALLGSLLTVGLLAGCMNRYDITLSNGAQTTSKGRPKLDAQGYYNFIDAEGRTNRIHKAQIRLMEPHEERDSRDSFSPRPITTAPR